jgi:hypothetical protein
VALHGCLRARPSTVHTTSPAGFRCETRTVEAPCASCLDSRHRARTASREVRRMNGSTSNAKDRGRTSASGVSPCFGQIAQAREVRRAAASSRVCSLTGRPLPVVLQFLYHSLGVFEQTSHRHSERRACFLRDTERIERVAQCRRQLVVYNEN